MSAKILSFDTGLVEYDINGKTKVSFNPSDSNFIDRFYETMKELDARQNTAEKEVVKLDDDPEAMYAYVTEKDRAMRTSIDGLLGEGVADALFEDINCYAMADGLPVWMNLMFAIADEINDAIEAETKKTDPRVKAYNKKYDAMLAKYKKTTPNRQIHK